jgi:hypothetical protein
MGRLTFFILVAILCRFLPCDAGRYAVIVGCNKGGRSVAPLKYAENDAREFADILQTLGGFQPINVRTLSSCDSARLGRNLLAIDSLMRLDKDPGSLFLFYYSGHADAANLFLGNERYPLSKVHGYFDSCAASIKIGIFDACYSGIVTTLKGGKQTQPFYFQDPKTVEGQVIIASSAASEAAQESQTLKGSIFSHHWFNALRGSADISGSKQVTVNQAYQYAYRKTLETTALISGEIQHPVYKFDIHGQGDIVLTSLSKLSSCLVFDGTCEGKFLVLSEDYIDVFADFSKKSLTESAIALRPGTYRIINALGRNISTHSFSLKQGETYRMDAGLLDQTPPSISRIKGPTEGPAPTLKNEGSPLSAHSFGFGSCGMFLINDNGGSLVKPGLNYINSWFANTSMDLFLDFQLIFPEINPGLLFGFDYFFGEQRGPLFAGMALGPHYFRKAGPEFRDRSAVAFLCHAGYTVDISRQMQFRFQIPYELYVGTKFAQVIGLELQCMFFGQYRDVKVLHL